MNALACRLTLAFLLLMMAACAKPGTQKSKANEDIALMEAQVPLPEKIDKLSLTERKVHDDPAAGVQYRYTGDLVYYVDVFVYPLKEQQKPLLIASKEQELLENELAHFHAELKYATDQGWYQSANPMDVRIHNWTIEYAANGKPRITSFLVAQGEYNIHKANVELASYLALSEFNGYFVKIRLTHPPYPGLRGEIDTFAKKLYHSLYGSQMQLPVITIGKDEQKIEVACMPGESMLECMGRGMRRLAPDQSENAT